ncbi:MAG: hypothetical protein KC777_06780 [Cyanobacteria bacterium HKST-UBA02]|nr:hypothetical protein [Cyanobacteria bacterium HKST-UBA02]
MKKTFRLKVLLAILLLELLGIAVLILRRQDGFGGSLSTAADNILPGSDQVWSAVDQVWYGAKIFAIVAIVVAGLLLLALRFSITGYRAYLVHRTLLEIEICLMEMFARLSSQGVDKRRDRMVDIMTAAEKCKVNESASFVVNINQDKGATQKTAREIISADKQDLSGFRSKRRSARLNAFALEAALNGQFRAARNQILVKKQEAFKQGKEQPEVISGLLELLSLPRDLSEQQIEEELAKKNPLGVFPVVVQTAIRFWSHPGKLRYRKDGVDLTGWEALYEMRRV